MSRFKAINARHENPFSLHFHPREEFPDVQFFFFRVFLVLVAILVSNSRSHKKYRQTEGPKPQKEWTRACACEPNNCRSFGTAPANSCARTSPSPFFFSSPCPAVLPLRASPSILSSKIPQPSVHGSSSHGLLVRTNTTSDFVKPVAINCSKSSNCILIF